MLMNDYRERISELEALKEITVNNCGTKIKAIDREIKKIRNRQ
jgi:hypothetical protein